MSWRVHGKRSKLCKQVNFIKINASSCSDFSAWQWSGELSDLRLTRLSATSVIKMIISVAVWRIYPSWVNDKLRAWEGLGHSGMFWAHGRGSRGTIFVRSSKLSLFFPELFPFRRAFFFVSRAFERFGSKCSSSGAFELDDVLGLFLKTPLRHRAFFANFDYDHKYFLKISFLFSKAEPILLAWQLWRSQLWAKHFGDGTSKTGMTTRLPGVGEIERRRTIDRRRDRYESCAMIHGPEEKKNTRKSACDCAKAQPFIIYKPASFEEPVSETRRRYRTRFALRCFRGRGCTAAGRSGCSAGTAKKSSHPWHFRCWSLRRNELECTDLVRWTEALHRFSSRDAIIVVCSALEKHLDGDFTPDQEKETTFKRWPPGYQSWKLGLALNGLRQDPLDLSFWSFLTFLQYGIEKVGRHLLWKFHTKIQRKSWSNVAPKLGACIRFLYKVVHKNGRLRKFNRAREIEFTFFIAWTIFKKLGTLVHHVHGCKMLPQVF